MNEFSITLDALAAELNGEQWQPGDITLADLTQKTGKSWNTCSRFLAARQDLRKVPNVYVPHLRRRVTVFRPKVV
jgi:hypothetical protein